MQIRTCGDTHRSKTIQRKDPHKELQLIVVEHENMGPDGTVFFGN